LNDTYTDVSLINFWAGLKEEFPHVSSVATSGFIYIFMWNRGLKICSKFITYQAQQEISVKFWVVM
jgi:hypothetical protein